MLQDEESLPPLDDASFPTGARAKLTRVLNWLGYIKEHCERHMEQLNKGETLTGAHIRWTAGRQAVKRVVCMVNILETESRSCSSLNMLVQWLDYWESTIRALFVSTHRQANIITKVVEQLAATAA
eukprot:Gregarina_sp_Poly_1__4645@NODE_2483_length_2069_cov_49_698302_g206_i1_p2_GENE_NODE_2483_length_2069_cov_49_698302_g206_i1NODE_2483_length_2069_cov_49_698302_g206_i1_p2_ORF_typecomplete_len126_score10_81DUF2200/PF09966_9/0_023DUF2200/PF09966_9/3_8e03Herpes_ori_bp/PF02399_15/0_16Opi1/PF08618_10/5_8Opi1/PF08618_10/34_NODE_2483_length_2069_cov_49_698302_g206_i110501427